MRLGIIRLYVGGSGELGFYNMQELGLAKELIKDSNIEVYIFILRNKRKYSQVEKVVIQENIKIIYLPALSIGTHGIINPQFIKEYKLDIVQLNSDIQLNTHRMLKWCLVNKIPVYTYIGTIFSDSTNPIKKILSKLLYKYNSRIMLHVHNIAKTPSVYKQIATSGISSVEIIPVGIDVDNFKYIENVMKEHIRDKFSIAKDKKVILFIGRLEEYKKPLFLIDILNEILNESEDYFLVVVGRGSLKENLISLIEKNELKSKFKYIESIPNDRIGELYMLSDCLVNLNDHEIYGMSILESMYCKCPVVAINAPGPSFVISDGEDGLITYSYNVDEWCEKINEVINKRDILGVNARKKVENELTWTAISEKFLSLYNVLLS